MSLLAETLPHIIGGLTVTGLIGAATWTTHRIRLRRTTSSAFAVHATTPAPEAGREQQPAHPALEGTVMTLRAYTLLGTTGTDDRPVRRESTRPVGSIITVVVDGSAERFELTGIPLQDGTFAAEPLDRYL
ncbi:hypothetical protein ACGFWE_08175 [Streptomyces sp. NPDC048523]|uniref:hypothetical protein n=1 Tax=Streptomyces sp. NPDC048523 TaxID=3365567 RepID=UPI003713CD99